VALDTTEEEQIESIKNFVKQYGPSVLIAIVLSLGGTYGYRSWETSERVERESASAAYEGLASAITALPESNETLADAIGEMAGTLKSDHPDSTYAVFASLQMAKLAVEQGDFAVAEAEFRWALEYADPSLEAPIRIRLARVLKADNRFELALEVLDKKIELFAYGPTWHEARGDILLMLKETDQARQAYQIAVNTSGELTAPSLIMKLEDITYAKVIPELTAETDEVSEPEEIEE